MTSETPRPIRRLGVISDIHGNLEALQAVLAALEAAEVDEVICCGDVVGYGASPNECVELLRSEAIDTILGNHDSAALHDHEMAFFNEMARDAVLWTRDELSEENRLWLESLPMTISRHGAHFVHASPDDPAQWNYILTYVEARKAFGFFEEEMCFIGHSHQPFFIALRGEELHHHRGSEIGLVEGTRHLVNAGSVGQPRDRDPRAACVLVDFDERRIVLHRIDYDIEKAQRRIRDRGSHRELAERLAHGY